VVFGDIGTSPLYTVSVTLKASSSGGTVAPEAVLGIVSLIFWSLIVVISIKYALLIMRADNHGEGGILALLALISPRRARQSRRRAVMVVIGLLGATLLYGDGAITPAISVLSAIEGLKVYAPQTEHVIVPLTVAILVLLFVVQRKGTSFIGGIFGPVMLVWFVAIALLGGHCASAGHPCCAQSVPGDHLSLERGARGLRGDRRRLPSGDRRGSVVCRHGSFRPAADPRRLVRLRAARAHA